MPTFCTATLAAIAISSTPYMPCPTGWPAAPAGVEQLVLRPQPEKDDRLRPLNRAGEWYSVNTGRAYTQADGDQDAIKQVWVSGTRCIIYDNRERNVAMACDFGGGK